MHNHARRALAASVVAASLALPAHAGDPLIQFLDGFWVITGSSGFDPDVNVGGDEIEDNAFASGELLPGETASAGGGGTSSGPFAARFDWGFQSSARGSGAWDLSLFISRTTTALVTPGSSGFATITYEPVRSILIQIGDPSDPGAMALPYLIEDTFGNVTLSTVAGEPGGFDGSMIMPGVYELGFGTLFASAGNGGTDGSIVTTPLLDFRLTILPAPGTLGVALGAIAVGARRRR